MNAGRYLLLFQHGEIDSAQRVAGLSTQCGLRLVYKDKKCALWVERPERLLALGDGKMALGFLFSEMGLPLTQADLPLPPSSIDNQSGVPGGYWGSYLSISIQGDTYQIARDPLGFMPCYYLEDRQATIFASDPALLFAVSGRKPQINWSAMAAHLSQSQLRSERTCLDGILELLAGHLFKWDGGGTQIRPFWAPWDHVTVRQHFTPIETAQTLRTVIDRCVRAWASMFEGALLTCSGGLDSSIVAAAFAPEARLTCLNIIAGTGEGDERNYARAMSTALSRDLLERHFMFDDIDITCSNAAFLARPVGQVYLQSLEKQCKRAGEQTSATAIFTGSGGDNVFCFLQSATPIVDRYRAEGLGYGIVETAADICSLTGCSIWTALGQALRRAAAPAAYVWREDYRYLAAAERYDHASGHPWLRAPTGTLPGKAAHVAMLLRVHNYVDGLQGAHDIPVVAPLLSQPIVELCLSIPTWHWCRGGRDRAPARDAYATQLPGQIINRRSKGGPGDFVAHVFETNRAAIAALLLDGHMAGNAMLDMSAIASFLADPRPHRDDSHLRLLTLVDAEAWTRGWLAGGPAVAR